MFDYTSLAASLILAILFYILRKGYAERVAHANERAEDARKGQDVVQLSLDEYRADSQRTVDRLVRAERRVAVLEAKPNADVAAFFAEVFAEVKSARAKFPASVGNMVALTEEVGELAKAMIDEPSERVRAEAVQVAAMALRVALEGDPTLDGLRDTNEAGLHPKAAGE